MKTTLISFLGNSRASGDYNRVAYSYQGKLCEPVTYIGYALHQLVHPERFLILGTTGSMWDHLFESDLELEQQYEEQRLQLMESVDYKESVTQEQLNELAPLLSKALDTEVILRIIPAARTEAEQLEVLEQINSALDDAEGGSLYLDVTHGFRSMPMVSFAAVQFLNTVKPGIEVKNIFYGEYDHDTKDQEIGTGQIIELSGLLNLGRWNRAFHHSDSTGDYSMVADLLADRPELAQKISEGSFYESVHFFGEARSSFSAARNMLEDETFTGPAALFKPVLLERTSWVNESQLYLRQRAQAMRSLENNDFLRAALYGYEAYLSMKMREDRWYGTQVDNADARQKFTEEFRENGSFKSPEEKQEYHFLRLLRNALAHGEHALRKEIRPVVRDARELRARLRRALNVLLF